MTTPSQPLQWGILGTGTIAHTFARGLEASQTGQLIAVGSRSERGAQDFADDFPDAGLTPHASYGELLADPRVQAVYISTPHPAHAQWAIRAAEAGKHVLCEKPLAMGHDEATTMLLAARRHGVFFMEAFMYRFHPQMARLAELIRERAIGDVRFIRANFSFATPFNAASRLFKAGLGGGGILDVGCYCASVARFIAGAAEGRPFLDPVVVRGTGQLGATGVDEYAIASLRFPNGIVAQIAAGVSLTLENTLQVVGTGGSLVVPHPWLPNQAKAGFTKIIVFKAGIPEEIVVESDRGLYTLEADHVAEQLAAGQTQSPVIPWEDSLGNIRVLDDWRRQVAG